jgi:hypothetical protein
VEVETTEYLGEDGVGGRCFIKVTPTTTIDGEEDVTVLIVSADPFPLQRCNTTRRRRTA